MSVPKEANNAERDDGRRRRIWSEEEKRRNLAETFEPGASVSIVARRHDLNANLLFTWRRTLGAAASGPGDEAVRLVPARTGVTIGADCDPSDNAKSVG
jgi:transposase-like protein